MSPTRWKVVLGLTVIACLALLLWGGRGDAGTAHAPPSVEESVVVGRPDVVPPSWQRWDALGERCTYWIAPPSAPTEAITWRGCEGANVAADACRSMEVAWPTGGLASVPAITRPLAWVDEGGNGWLALRRDVAGAVPYHDVLVAELDGAVRFRMRHVGPPDAGCSALPASFHEGRLAIEVHGDGVSLRSGDERLVFVDVGDWQPTLSPLADASTSVVSWIGGRDLWLRMVAPSGALFAHDPSFASERKVWPRTTGDLPLAGAPLPWKGQVFFSAGSYGAVEIVTYDAERGARPLIRHADTSRGASNLGTDGEVLVWTEGDGRTAGEPIYPRRHMMKAPFTTDAGALAPVRVRSDPSGSMALNPFVVGCGHAGHEGAAPRGQVIVRLSDGVAWELEGPDQPRGFSWSTLLAITCTEAVIAIDAPVATVARVRLDRLGVGTPPR